MKLLELFAGSCELSKRAEKRGYQTFAVDHKDFDGIDLVADIEKLLFTNIPFVPDVFWASPDCTTYSIAAIAKHRDNTVPKSDYAKKSDSVNLNMLSLMKTFIAMNPDMVFFIENPVGMLRKMPFMQEFKRHTVGIVNMVMIELNQQIFGLTRKNGFLAKNVTTNAGTNAVT